MKTRLLITCAFLLAASAGPARAEIKDTAELVPASTLAYLELNQPGQTGKDLAVLLKGSALDDLPGVITKFRAKVGAQVFFGGEEVAMVGSFIGPEMLAELGRIQGAAVAFTGFTKDRQPEVVAYVLTGESNVPGIIMRAFLTAYPWMHSAGEFEAVRLYRHGPMNLGIRPVPPGGAPAAAPAKVELTGPTYAMMPGLIIVGSSPDSVKDVIRRAKGKANGASLATVAAFKEAAKLRERAGLFGYADPATLTHMMGYWAMAVPARASGADTDAPPQAKPAEDAAKAEDSIDAEVKASQALASRLLDAALNTKAVRALAASLTLRNGDVDLQTQLILDPKETSPLLELLPDKPADPQIFHAVPRGSLFVITQSMGDGEKRWENLLKLVDATAKAAGAPDAPSKMAKALEDKLGLQFGKDIFGKITGIAIAVPSRTDLPKGGSVLPMLTIAATDEDAAKSLEETIPKLVAVAARDEVSPSTEEIDGHKIRSVPGNSLPWRSAIHYSRHGNYLVIGQDRKQVAAALAGATKKEGLLTDARAATAVKNLDAPIVLGLWSAGPTLAQALTEFSGSSMRPGVIEKPAPPGVGGGGGGGGGGQPAPPAKKGGPAAQSPAERHTKELAKITDPLSPVVITLHRKPEQLTLVVRQPAFKTASAKLVTALVEMGLQMSMLRRGGFGPGVQSEAIEEAIPVPTKP